MRYQTVRSSAYSSRMPYLLFSLQKTEADYDLGSVDTNWGGVSGNGDVGAKRSGSDHACHRPGDSGLPVLRGDHLLHGQDVQVLRSISGSRAGLIV